MALKVETFKYTTDYKEWVAENGHLIAEVISIITFNNGVSERIVITYKEVTEE